MKPKYFFIIASLLVSSWKLSTDSFAQNNSVILDGVYIVLAGGTAATNVYFVVDQNSPSGIIRPGGGHITSEGQYNYVKWNSGTSTGNYVFPFGVGGTAADYIPFTFNKTTSTSSEIAMSTWTTNPQNAPHPAISNVAAVSNMVGIPDSVKNAIDRFWDIQSSSAVSADLTFSYRGVENTTIVPTDIFQAQHWNGTTWDAQAGLGNPGITTGIGTVGPIPGQTTFSPWVLTRVGLTASITAFQNVKCNNQCTGTAVVTPTGGASPYTYSWSGGQTNDTATGLCAGTHTVTVTDAVNATTTTTVTITEPPALSGSITPTDISCYGQCNGSALITASGGTTGYSYSWNTLPVQTAINASGLCVGSYTCTITDTNSCTATQSIAISGPSVLSATSSSTPATCGNANGTVTANASGGTTGYTYNWNPSGQTTQTATALASGIYTCTVTDANGCTTTTTVSITNSNGPIGTISKTDVICNGDNTGNATVAVTGGTSPFTYSWSPSGGTTATANGLSAGTFICTITDSFGCSSIQTVTIAEPTAITISTNTTQTGCTTNTGTATATPSGGTPGYTYSWGNGQSSQTATGLAAGNYTVTVTDGNGCTQTQTASVTVVLGPSSSATATAYHIIAGSSTQLNATGGTSYHWLPSTGLSCDTCQTTTASPTQTSSYCVIVTDINSCTDSSCLTITVEIPCPGEFTVPNAFSPNNDGHNDNFCLQGWNNCVKKFNILVFDRWGEKVFESNDPSFCWDGSYMPTLLGIGSGKPMECAVFVYSIYATLFSDEKIAKKGNISLIR